MGKQTQASIHNFHGGMVIIAVVAGPFLLNLLLPERIYNSLYDNGVLAMFTS